MADACIAPWWRAAVQLGNPFYDLFGFHDVMSIFVIFWLQPSLFLSMYQDRQGAGLASASHKGMKPPYHIMIRSENLSYGSPLQCELNMWLHHHRLLPL